MFNTPPEMTRNTYGELGAFDTPTARMAPDGELAFTVGALGEQQRFNLTFQALPWLEGAFRYSHIVGRFPGYDDKHFYDRSFGAKVRLIKESDELPDLSVGIRDILGTGVLSAEYVVATKNVGPLDFTAGIGWGELSQDETFSNPFGVVSSSFKSRGRPRSTGQFDFGVFFRGPKSGAFGSVAWQTPVEGLQLLAEYSSDKYADYNYDGAIKVRSPVNIGLSYRPFDNITVSAGWLYGAIYGLTLSVRGDPSKSYASALRLGPEVPKPAIRTITQQQDALQELGNRTSQTQSSLSGKTPWVDVPTPEQYSRQILLQALLSETPGVRSAEPSGKSLIIDARISANPSDQCNRYAQVSRVNGSEFVSLAITDLQDPAGAVFVCTAGAEHPFTSVSGVTSPPQRTAEYAKKIKSDLGSQDVSFVGLTIGANEAWLYYENYRYYRAAEAAGRAVRVLMADLPPDIEIFHLTPGYLGMSLNEITVYRSKLERTLATGGPHTNSTNVVNVSPPTAASSLSEGDNARVEWPTLYTSFDPRLTQRVFDPAQPIQFMVYGDLVNLVQITPQISIVSELTGTIWSNYTFSRDAGSELHHVRTDILKYQDHGKYGISSLSLAYRTQIADTVVGEVKAGILEDMYAGVGGQLVWRPSESRFAVGADIYQVWQRAYDRLFGLQKFGGKHYSVLTGHVTAYYDSPWYGLRFAVHAGHYLAGDRGATFEISRRFSSGVEIGAWATFTNVPFSKFGEGSFDKGIMIHIPFEWGLPIWTQSSYDLHMASLTRDGGQRLAGDDSLFTITDSTSYGQIMDHADAIIDP